MKDKLKKILNLIKRKMRFSIILLTIILAFTLTVYWRNETKKAIEDWRKTNEIGTENKISAEELTVIIKYEIYLWDFTYRKIWTYDVLILASGVLLFIALKRDNDCEKEKNKILK